MISSETLCSATTTHPRVRDWHRRKGLQGFPSPAGRNNDQMANKPCILIFFLFLLGTLSKLLELWQPRGCAHSLGAPSGDEPFPDIHPKPPWHSFSLSLALALLTDSREELQAAPSTLQVVLPSSLLPNSLLPKAPAAFPASLSLST